MRAKITAYNNNYSDGNCSDFSLNCFWGEDYKNVFYLDGSLGRSTFEDIIETETDATGQSVRVQNTSIERFNLSVIAITPLLQFLKKIDKHDVKTIELIDTGDIYNITNIDIEDQGDILTPSNLVYITFEDEPISKVSPNAYNVTDGKLAFWGFGGAPVINGSMRFFQGATNPVFLAQQLYFENDGVTPTASGDVQMLAYAITDSGNENLIGIFNGEFGDSFDDATKWQSTQNISNYFDAASVVQHLNDVLFYKRAFAEANGYISDEQEERAVVIRFDLNINNGAYQSIDQPKAYTIRGGFNSTKLIDPNTGEYGPTLLGNNNPPEKNTLNNIQDIRQNTGTGLTQLITSFTLNSVTPFSNEYLIDIASSGEYSYTSQFNTKGGFSGATFMGIDTAPIPPIATNFVNYCFTLDNLQPIGHDINVLVAPIGTNPFEVVLNWQYIRQGIFNNIGDIVAAGDAKLLIDGVVFNTYPAIVPASLTVSGTETITLPDTNIHTVKFECPVSSGDTIYTEFELQLKPLF